MFTQTSDIFDIVADARVIPVNANVNSKGLAVMGKGLAKEAATRFPDLPSELGLAYRVHGIGVYLFSYENNENIITFPTKYDWRYGSDVNLIAKSCVQMRDLADRHRLTRIVMPKVGCGLGLLNWLDVEPILDRYLDERFVVCIL